MKKTIKLAIAAIILCSGFAMQGSAKQKVEPRYLFGFSASFADSTVYFTDIQKVDSAWVDTKTKFLLGRDEYSGQLKRYFASKEMPNRTCVVLFAENIKKAEKKLKKLKETYTMNAKGGYDVRYMTKAEFEFTPVYMGIEEEEIAVDTPKKDKKEKEKKENKDKKSGNKEDKVKRPKGKHPKL